MPIITITAGDPGNVLSVHSDFIDTATYIHALKQASDVNHVTAQPFAPDKPHPDTIVVRVDGIGDVVSVTADRADSTLTVLALLDAAAFLITQSHNEGH